MEEKKLLREQSTKEAKSGYQYLSTEDESDNIIGSNREKSDIAIAILDTTWLSSFVAEICKVCKITKLCEIQPLLI